LTRHQKVENKAIFLPLSSSSLFLFHRNHKSSIELICRQKMLPRSAFAALISIWSSQTTAVRGDLIANPSAGSFILSQDSINTIPAAGRLTITSDVPVNIQRYADVDGRIVDGAQPVSGANVQVIVTSDCDSPEIVPSVAFDNVTGALDINGLDEASDVSYLEPTWYQALWSYRSYWADYFYATAATDISVDIELDSEANSSSASLTASTTQPDPTSAITTTVSLSEEEGASGSTPQDEPASDEAAAKESDGSSSATFRRSFLRQTMATFAVLYATNLIFIGVAGNTLLGFGKVAVAAIAVSALFTKNHQKNNRAHANIPRKLQTCNYNVDILIDGCYNSLIINAPASRIIEAELVNFTSTQNANDTATTDYSAVLQFPISENNTELPPNTTVPNLECLILAEGRPFIDSTGKSLHASSVVEVTASSWLGYLAEGESKVKTIFGNETETNEKSLLGEEWTRRALAEHASVASFSAFSIALMTNQAPSILVEDALKAALDEVRHAKVSFDIASLLTGKEIAPGPLPASSLDFKQDLATLALAVAKEGCVDETLSAFSAALEANEIHDAIESNADQTKYSGVNRDTLILMRDELRKIAAEESTHSALAWRTLNWICRMNSNSCNAVHAEVFDRDYLEMRINQVVSIKRNEVLRMIHNEWEQVFVSHKTKLGMDSNDQEHVCDAVYEQDKVLNDLSEITTLTASIKRNLMY
jgi:hypothetical protein